MLYFINGKRNTDADRAIVAARHIGLHPGCRNASYQCSEAGAVTGDDFNFAIGFNNSSMRNEGLGALIVRVGIDVVNRKGSADRYTGIGCFAAVCIWCGSGTT